MSVVILGGNECMERKYKELCEEYKCSAMVFTRMNGGLKNKLGSPDLIVMFTGTMSHKMLKSALCETKGQKLIVERLKSASASALRGVLEKHANA